MDKHEPWIEKYRPTHFDDIVLDPTNRTLFQQIIKKRHFPNLLFYGPPGSGKTTTAINLINEYQTVVNSSFIMNKGNIIHLNASDERGIDIIRNQIHQFVSTKNLFEVGIKFVILDEVDYMTKNAQQALKYLLQTTTQNVRFCLICNYISKIDESLQNEFICIRFNQLPSTDIFQFIRTICEKEDIPLSDIMIEKIQLTYKSDIRSMINFIQSNHCYLVKESCRKECILNSAVWERLHQKMRSTKNDAFSIKNLIGEISETFNVDKKQIIQNYFNYVIRTYPQFITPDYLNMVEMLVHNSENIPLDIQLDYFTLHR